MPYYSDDEDKKLAGQQDGTVALGPQSAQISGQGSAAPGQVATPVQSPQAKNPGNFVGLQQYLQANKPQAEKLGGQVAGVVSGAAQQAQQDVGAFKAEAEKQVVGPAAIGQQTTAKLAQTPGQLSSEERKQLQETSKAQYKGPQDVTGFGDVYNKAAQSSKKAQEAIKGTESEEGRMGLIKQVSTGPRTQGMNVFDQALLSAGTGLQKVAGAAEQAKQAGIPDAFTGATKEVQEKINKTSQETAKAQAETSKAIQDSLNAWKSKFQGAGIKDDPNTPQNEAVLANRSGQNGRLAQAQQLLQDQNNPLLQDISDLSLDQATLDAFGLSAGQSLYDLDLRNYINPANVANLNAANVATAEDYSNYEALAELAGISPDILDPAKKSQAGTAVLAPKINKEQLAKDVAAKEAAYQQVYNTKYPFYYTGSAGRMSWNQSPAELEALINNPSGIFQRAFTPSMQAELKNQLEQLKGSYSAGKKVKKN